MKKKIYSILFWSMFGIYVFLMFDLFFRPAFMLSQWREGSPIVRSFNPVPFKTIGAYLSSYNLFNIAVVHNVLWNILVFVPYGLYVQIIRKQGKLWKGMAVIAGTSLLIELIQFAAGAGVCDVDDLLLNFIGGLLGIGLYALMLKIWKTREKVKTIVMAASALVGIPVILLYGIVFLSNYSR